MSLVLQPLKNWTCSNPNWMTWKHLPSRRHKKQWLKHSRFWRNSMPRWDLSESFDVHNPNMTICFQRLRLLEDGWPRNDWHIDSHWCLATTESASNAWLAEKTRRVKPLLWFRAMRRRPSPNRRDESGLFLLMFVLLRSPVIHMYMYMYMYIHIYIYKKPTPQSHHGSQQEIWGTPAWVVRAVVSSAWWRQTFYWDRVESGVGSGVWYMLALLGLRQNGNETRLNLQKRWYHGIMAQSV